MICKEKVNEYAENGICTSWEFNVFDVDLYLVHNDNEWQFRLIEYAAGVQHVRHKRHGTDTTRRVHDIDNDCSEAGCL